MQLYLTTKPGTPAPVSTSGPHLIAHRRVSKGTGANGGAAHTLATPASSPSTLPTNVTVGVYSDSYAFLRDEFLVSADGGATWRLVPSPTVVSAGVYTIPAFSSSWTVVTDFDNQATVTENLAYGEYSAGNNPLLTRYYRLPRACQTLGVELRTPDGDPLTVLDNRLTVGILGLVGAGGALTQPSTIVYNSAFSNFRPLVASAGGIVKLTFGLSAYPADGFATETVSFRTLLIPDAAATAPSVTWQPNTVRLNPALGFNVPLITRVNSTSVTLNPLAVNYAGVQLINPSARTFVTADGTTYQITVTQAGEFNLRSSTYVPPIGEISVITFSPNASGIRMIGSLPIDNPARALGGAAVLAGRPVAPDGGAWSSGDLGGVSLGNGSMAVVGDVLVQVSGPVAVGDTLTPASATQFGVGSGPLRVIQGSQGSGAGVAIARLQPAGGAGGGLTTEDVDDRVNTLLVVGAGITKVYDDVANTLTLSVTPVSGARTGKKATASRTSNQSVSANTWTTITWTAETDPEGWINTSTGVLTLPSGFEYEITGFVRVTGSAGTTFIGLSSGTTPSANFVEFVSTSTQSAIGIRPLTVSAGTYILTTFSSVATTIGVDSGATTNVSIRQLHS